MTRARTDCAAELAGIAFGLNQRIDERHANARRTWLALGSPEYLCSRMVAQLDAASCLRDEPCTVEEELPPDGVASISVKFHTH